LSEVLIISTCIYPLLEEKFVRPLREIAESLGYSAEVRNRREKIRPECSRVIISGTALKDLDYLNYVEKLQVAYEA